MAKLIDFVVWHWRENGRPGTYRFKIGGCKPGGEFQEALAAVKSIPVQWREWLPEEKLWEVAALPEVETILSETFENGNICLEVVKSQMRLL